MSRFLRLFEFPVALTILCTMSALAQAPNPYGLAVSVENAKKAAAAALDEARKGNWKMAVAVVDTGGTLVYYEKMDNTQIGSADIAIEISAPETPGRFALKFDLVSEGIDWFERCGSPTTNRSVLVI